MAPCLVPVDGFAPVGGLSRSLGEVHAEDLAPAESRDVAPAAAGAEAEGPERERTPSERYEPSAPAPEQSSARLLELVALADEEPELATSSRT
ncbi:hypothetical protein AB0E64_22805 [Streptomyces caelestis]|uniref:Uncharacterized protein n=1 Tax=Streptomyces caelestis TaxID=36816 RepID=A0A7W9H7N9_9ACTN|nr:hypothetical protein [Streptomyces caelestis]MBB5796821.1 hypothetical protein [Streptomyces caelestis]GGW33846.1 hypothetical protein GCM10010320_11140 [Streptomyces caelestis]